MIAGRSKSRVAPRIRPLLPRRRTTRSRLRCATTLPARTDFLLEAHQTTLVQPFVAPSEQPNIRFAIEPAGADNPMDKCDTHSRESFHELTTLLNLKCSWIP